MSRARSFVEVLERELWEITRLRRLRVAPGLAAVEPDPFPSPPQTKPNGCLEDIEDDVIRSAHARNLVGVSLSGGGIRSATFNLGILQGLAEADLMRKVDYLSTVSGGGYIGTWLAAWIYRHGFATVQDGLKPNRTQRVGEGQRNEEPEVGFLREYSNYLTPRLGLLGPDTWTAISVYLRNLVLNQAVLLLFLAFILLLPRVLVYLTTILAELNSNYGGPSWLSLAAAGLLAFCAVLATQFNMAYFQERPQGGRQSVFTNMDGSSPTLAGLLNRADTSGEARWKLQDHDHIEIWSPFFGHRKTLPGGFEVRVNPQIPLGAPGRFTLPEAAQGETTLDLLDVVTRVNVYPGFAGFGHVFFSVALPLVAACWLAAFWVKSHSAHLLASSLHWWHWALAGAAAYFAMWLVAVIIDFIRHADVHQWAGHSNPRRVGRFFSYVVEFLAPLFAGAVGGSLFWAITSNLRRWRGDPHEAPWRVATLGVAMLIGIVLITAVVHMGLRGILFHDERREWWARAGAYILIMGIFWLVVASIAVYSPLGLVELRGLARGWIRAAGIGWILSTLIGVLGARSSKVGPTTSRSWLDVALSFTPWIFIAGYLVVIAYYLQLVLVKMIASGSDVRGAFIRFYGQYTPAESPASHWILMDTIQNWRLPIFLVAVAAACALLAWRVDINEFSMHLFYRNRLVRAYLGASHRERSPNPFTGFDADDDIHLKDISSIHKYDGPYPIINAALNLVHGKDLAWQERKAESFVMTPLFCGFDSWIENEQSAPDTTSTLESYAFRPTAAFAYPGGGFFLGSAMSISGAAVSPNMGYASSASLSFLLTMFNARLGFWAGNPRRRDSWRTPGPVFGLFAMIAELLGQTDDESSSVYLSDGGHFENLALYELVKRRCRLIIVCDAGQDSGYEFGDLGGAIRKIRSDFGIEINMHPEQIRPQAAAGFSQVHCAAGEIKYSTAGPDLNIENGTLLYIKPSLTGDEPVDVLNYKAEHSTFPHDKTANQWFTESQFESYRRLGLHIIRSILAELPGRSSELSVPDLATQIRNGFPGI